MTWYPIENSNEIDSPALLVYPERIAENIELAIQIAGGDMEKLRPHVKTNKMGAVCSMMIQAGIRKFKCATIAEAEMLGLAEAPDVLLAYQPVGPKVDRLLQLVKFYPNTYFSCLVDNADTVRTLAARCNQEKLVLDVYIDLNVGMNRTGVSPEKAGGLAELIRSFDSLRLVGLHAYDGHIHDTDIQVRRQAADKVYVQTEQVWKELSPFYPHPLVMVMGGTPTFPIHIRRAHCECSPGTFIFWDWGYRELLPDLPFQWAALVMTRVVSIVDPHRICVDLGHKAIGSENPLPRVHFLNAPDAVPVAHSEEHLVLDVPDSAVYTPGDVLYGVPVHICPTVALYGKASMIFANQNRGYLKVTARNRLLTV